MSFCISPYYMTGPTSDHQPHISLVNCRKLIPSLFGNSCFEIYGANSKRNFLVPRIMMVVSGYVRTGHRVSPYRPTSSSSNSVPDALQLVQYVLHCMAVIAPTLLARPELSEDENGSCVKKRTGSASRHCLLAGFVQGGIK
jgi:hypothetical protein